MRTTYNSIPQALAEVLRGTTEDILIGPEVWQPVERLPAFAHLQDDDGRVWYFLIVSKAAAADEPHTVMMAIRKGARGAFVADMARIALGRAIHIFGEEAELSKAMFQLWPCERTALILAAVNTEKRAVLQ